MSADAQTEYWNRRAKYQFHYKGETFYTITPIPLYFYRRKRLLDSLAPLVEPKQVQSICDFGCGDGWYIQFFDRCFPGKRWTGIDISQGMLDQAIVRSPNARFMLFPSENQEGFLRQPGLVGAFDLVYSIAVFAHILNDADVAGLFCGLAETLSAGGKLVIFEQTGPRRVAGSSFCRRLSSDYKRIAESCGLVIQSSALIMFPAHVIFERRIAPKFYAYCADSGENDFLARVRANHNRLFRWLSRMAILLSPKSVWPDTGKLWGNSLIVFQKPKS
jgi:hypothetical protein